ncbi:MAG: NAD(P)H-hydrate dehydratase [Candidatus Cloacimonetes bacterium]|nr:NAD(P)H-hydrate dehydratase [Candidatus Cloacimonadota bacterium]MBL7149615.1 NAD(P)H-hydrate dehydratase [Candidatus Cloacimonadota bacterium]
MYILSREEMYYLDKYTIEKIGIPGKELMESAGKGCSEFIHQKLLKPHSKVAIFCGSGNNGGDGFVIARYLKNWGYKISIFLLGNPDKMSPETLENYESCRDLKIDITQINNAEIELSEFDLIVDAIFGVGLQGTIKGWSADLIEKINTSGKTVVAIDIASGVDTNTGQAEVAINADHTLTMANFKYGHFLEKGRERSGKVKVIDIGVPGELYEKFPPKAKLITDENVKYPERSPLSHKGDYGKVGIIAGSPGFSGAAIMASRAALRSGAGLITLFHPAGMELIFETQLLEVMTYTIPKLPFSLSRRSETKTERGDKEGFFKKLNSMDVLLVGPGIGTSNETVKLVKTILQKWNKPLVIDADGLNILSENEDILKMISGKPVILTPHIGEFARLTKKEISEILTDPLEELNNFIKKYKCNILLKSATTVFADGENFIFDISGNDGLATGGSGDVLAGIIVSFLGQKLPLEDAAISASYLMGKTAEKLAETRKPASIIPSDIIEEIFKY